MCYNGFELASSKIPTRTNTTNSCETKPAYSRQSSTYQTCRPWPQAMNSLLEVVQLSVGSLSRPSSLANLNGLNSEPKCSTETSREATHKSVPGGTDVPSEKTKGLFITTRAIVTCNRKINKF